jgi:hypothetical protein
MSFSSPYRLLNLASIEIDCLKQLLLGCSKVVVFYFESPSCIYLLAITPVMKKTQPLLAIMTTVKGDLSTSLC